MRWLGRADHHGGSLFLHDRRPSRPLEPLPTCKPPSECHLLSATRQFQAAGGSSSSGIGATMNRKLSLGLSVWLVCLAVESRAALLTDSPGFMKNVGQIERQARYYAVGDNASVYFEADAVVIDRAPDRDAPGVALRVGFPRARGPMRIEGVGARDSRVHSFVGSDPGRWQRSIPIYDQVRYRGI